MFTEIFAWIDYTLWKANSDRHSPDANHPQIHLYVGFCELCLVTYLSTVHRKNMSWLRSDFFNGTWIRTIIVASHSSVPNLHRSPSTFVYSQVNISLHSTFTFHRSQCMQKLGGGTSFGGDLWGYIHWITTILVSLDSFQPGLSSGPWHVHILYMGDTLSIAFYAFLFLGHNFW